MRQARSFILITMICLLVVTLAACGSGNNTGTDKASGSDAQSGTEKITLTLQTPVTGQERVSDKIIADYQAEHPNVTIKVDALDLGAHNVKLNTQAAAGALSDIVVVNAGAAMQPFVDAGLLAPLDDILEKDGLKDTFLPLVLDGYKFNDQQYALPMAYNLTALFYNKALFEKIGAEVPTTFEELVEVSKKFKAAGILPIALAEKEAWTGGLLFGSVLTRQNGGPGFIKDVLDGKRNFQDPDFVESIKKFEDLIKAGAFQEGVTAVDYFTGLNQFLNGEAAMHINGTWISAAFPTAKAINDLRVTEFPTVNGKGQITDFSAGPGIALAVSSKGKHTEQAKDFVHYYMMHFPSVSLDMDNAIGIAQKIDGDLKAKGYSDLNIQIQELFTKIKRVEPVDANLNAATSEAHNKTLQNLFIDPNVKPEDVAKEYQDAYEANK
ncbi:extracellular solute-binding protein [Paenibacillus durus]|uniref:extracellular solute-binding protein n=1 Tax=Paenibacillus durus TaxID=44251 RepID=UPI0005A97FBA|nr:extracellular solute-binding protein [Paenibacillus durus]